MREIQIENKTIGLVRPTYFIADLAANHDGDLERAKDLIYLCAEAGADAAKFQHFSANTIVSDTGFKSLSGQQSHQSKWKKSVFDVYQDASIDQDWTPILKETCKKAGITFLTSPYSYELVDKVDNYLSAYKIGSGDITWPGIIDYIASKNKPVFLATGASNIGEVDIAMSILLQHTNDIVLMQCNTNYTASLENFKYINLNVLKEYSRKYPDTILGLSDHTPGHATVLGAVTLGARVIEKHFTLDKALPGPDQVASLNPQELRDLVQGIRVVEQALGSKQKELQSSETENRAVARKSLIAKREIMRGELFSEQNISAKRPGTGRSPMDYWDLVGSLSEKAYKPDDFI